MKLRQQNSSTYHIAFFMVLASDHVTPATGKSPTVTLSKNCAAFGAAAGAVTEIANGWYKLAGNATDNNTLGELALRATAASCDDTPDKYIIVAFDPFAAADLGLTNLNATVSSRASQTSLDTVDDFVDTEITAIKAKTDGLPSDPADASDVAGAFSTVNTTLATIVGYIDTEIAAILTRLPAALVAGRMDSSTGAMAADVLTRAAIANDTGLKNIRSATAQAGSGTTITLDAGASAVNDFYKNDRIYIVSGLGAGQERFCTGYVGATKVATVAAWAVNPDATSVFTVSPFDAVQASVGGSVTVGGYSAGQDPATLVLDTAAAGHNTAGTIGQKINSAGGAADPLTNAVPGSYGAGTAGEALGKISAIKAKTDTIGALEVTVVAPVADDGDVALVRGDDYLAADGRALDWVNAAGTWPNLTGATITLTAKNPGASFTQAGTVVVPTGVNQQVRVELARTKVDPAGVFRYDLQAALASSGDVVTLATGTLTIAQDVT